MRNRALAILLALSGMAPGVAWSDPPPHPGAAKEPDARKILRPGEVEVKGKARKASVPTLTPPSVTVAPPAEERETFVHKIVEALDKEPFP